MTTDLMTIRQMCDKFDVTARTLRFYEAKELISPIREGQRRLFTKRDRARLFLILRGKRFGFSLEDIRQLLDLYDVDDQGQTQLQTSYQFAKDRLRSMQEQRDELSLAIDELNDLIVAGEKAMSTSPRHPT